MRIQKHRLLMLPCPSEIDSDGSARGVLWLLLIAAGLAAITGLVHPRSPWGEQPHRLAIELDEATALANVIWLDARAAEAYDEAHIPGALPLNEDDWEDQIDAVLLAWSPEYTVVVYCDGADCRASQHVAKTFA